MQGLTTSQSVGEETLQTDGLLACLAIEGDRIVRMILAHQVRTFVFVDRPLQGHVFGEALDPLSQLVDQPAFWTAQVVALSDEDFGTVLADCVTAPWQQERVLVHFHAYWTFHCI